LSAASAVVLFLERDFFVVVAAELSDAAESVLAAVFFLDLEVVDFRRVCGRIAALSSVWGGGCLLL